MKKFTDTYDDFIKICKGEKSETKLPIIPAIQIWELEYLPKINPKLESPPREWFLDAFDWMVAVQLIGGGTYGPFYRVDGDYFWPQIGNIYEEYSERKCFFGLERPINIDDVLKKYNIREETKRSHIYEISINLDMSPIIHNANIFLGKVKGGEGYQMNPNRIVVEIIKTNIIRKNVKKYALKGVEFDYNDFEEYYTEEK